MAKAGKRAGIPEEVRKELVLNARRYETAAFLENDPSRFMHSVSGDANREATAFVASALSFGSRAQFLPKIASIIDMAGGDVDSWIGSGRFERDFPRGSGECFYRFFAKGTMSAFFSAYRRVMEKHGTLGGLVRGGGRPGGLGAVKTVCEAFAGGGKPGIVPSGAHSACKRVCMFLRWMVRSGSPVDLGLWSDFIDKRTLVMPLDTHVVRQSMRLGLLPSPSASMSAALRLTSAMLDVFPDDPLKGDFALFGLGADGGREVEKSKG